MAEVAFRQFGAFIRSSSSPSAKAHQEPTTMMMTKVDVNPNLITP